MRRSAVLILLIAMMLMLGTVQALCLDTSLKVYDDAMLFTEEELEDLRERAAELCEVKKIDIVIVTTYDTRGRSSKEFADDYYDYNGFGKGDDYTGLLLLIDMAQRNVWISTTGKCIRYFNDKRIDDILDRITPYLTAGKYATAADLFLDEVERTPTTPLQRATSRIFTNALIAICVSGIAVRQMGKYNKGKKTTDANTYLDKYSLVLRFNRDTHIRTAVTKRYIESSSSRGGSSTHRGSSGRSHGGGGRRF